MKEDLFRINNTLLMYAYGVDENGLFYGKTGVMLCLMMSGKYLDCQSYFDIGGNLLDGLIKNSINAPTSFENGMAGLGWSICFLLKNDIIDGDVNSILHNIDERLIKELCHSGWSKTLGELIYFTERLRIVGKDITKYCEVINKYIYWRLENRLSSMTEFEYRALMSYVKQARVIFPQWGEILSEIEEKVHHINICDERGGIICSFEKKNVIHDNVLRNIEKCLNSIFFDNLIEDSFVYNRENDFITSCQEDICDKNLSLMSGLAGLGVGLIIKN